MILHKRELKKEEKQATLKVDTKENLSVVPAPIFTQ